ncbi:MAG: hypothetical protein MSB10_05255 [Clostridiales bacterium]|uniref:hypothetical protein n=1 Tax=Flavonifractor porci TaxID=3133422 RepID=UPI0030994908|nr:hypothetical protein [Clostridiales bacterium]
MKKSAALGAALFFCSRGNGMELDVAALPWDNNKNPVFWFGVNVYDGVFGPAFCA